MRYNLTVYIDPKPMVELAKTGALAGIGVEIPEDARYVRSAVAPDGQIVLYLEAHAFPTTPVDDVPGYRPVAVNGYLNYEPIDGHGIPEADGGPGK